MEARRTDPADRRLHEARPRDAESRSRRDVASRMRAALLRLEALGPPRPGAAVRRLDCLADPRRARRRQDPGRGGSGAPVVPILLVRQPHRPDCGRRARRDGSRGFRRHQLLPQGRAAALPRLGRAARVAERRDEPPLLRRGAGPAARPPAHEALVRRTRRLAAAGDLRPGDVRPASRREAADGRHHHAAADENHQAARRPTGTRSSPAARPSTIAAIWRAPSSTGSPGATRGASSAGRS